MTSDKTILVKHKRNYGNDVVMPVCENAKAFANIAQTKTLTADTLRNVKALGYYIKLQREEDIEKKLNNLAEGVS